MYCFIEGVECPRPEDGVNTVLVPVNLTGRFEDEYTYTCIGNFLPAPDMKAICQENGEWSLAPPTCTCK